MTPERQGLLTVLKGAKVKAIYTILGIVHTCEKCGHTSGLGILQRDIVKILSSNPDYTKTVSDIARLTFHDHTTVFYSLQPLTDLGLVTSIQEKKKAKRYLALTEKGRALV